jgi:drug/metabolite transporter (DMT)-like permease
VKHSHAVLHLAMLAVTFFWAANIVAVKWALAGFHPLALVQLRIACAGLIFLAMFVAQGKWRGLRLTRREWIFLFFIGLTGITLNQIGFIAGLERSSASHAALIVALGPVMVLVLSVSIRLEALTIPKFAGMLVAFAGVAILTTAKSSPNGHSTVVGDLIMLGGTVVFAIYTILMKEVVDRFDAVTLNTFSFVIGALLMAPFAASSIRGARWTDVPALSWWALSYAVLFGSVISYLVFARVLKELTAARVAAFAYIQPVIATGLGVLMLHERLSVRLFIGGALILGGLYLTERERGEELPMAAGEEPGPTTP